MRLQRHFFLNLQQMNEVTKNCVKSDFSVISLNLAINGLNDKAFRLTSKLCSLGAVCPCLGLYTCINSRKLYKMRLQRHFFLNLQQMNEVTRHFCWHQNFVPWKMSALGLYTCIKSWKKCIESDFKEIFFLNLQQMTEVTRCSCLHQNFVSKGLLAPVLGLYTCIKSWKKLYKIRLQRDCFLKLVANDRSDKRFLLTSKFCPLGVSIPAPGLYTCIKSWKKLYKIKLQRDFFKLVANDRTAKRFLLTSNFFPWGCLPWPAAIYIYQIMKRCV